MLDAFLEENPDATEEDLYLALGSPEELAIQLLDEYDLLNSLTHSLKNRTRIAAISGFLLGALLLCALSLSYWYFTTKGYVDVGIREYVIVESYPSPTIS